jgi:hypothetical protein
MPKASQVHIDKALEQISIAFMPQGLVAQDISAIVPVKNESNKFFVYSKDNLRVPSTIWSDGDKPNRSIWNLSNATYQTTRHGLDDLVTDRQRRNQDKAIRSEADTTEGLSAQIKLRIEKELFSLINTAANWDETTSLPATGAWNSNTTTSNPITPIDSATTSIRRRSGKVANRVVLSDPCFKAAKEHDSITDRVKHTSAESVSPAMLATLFNVEKVLVSGAVENSADEGLTDTLADIATDTAFVCYREPSPGLKKAATFYTFQVTEAGSPMRVRRYRDDEREGDVIEVSTHFVHKVVSSDTAYAIVDTIQ